MNATGRGLMQKWKREKSAWRPAIAASILTILSMSCRSLPEPTSAIARPTVPSPIVNGESVAAYDDATDRVSVPLWYWKKLIRYIAGAEAAFDTLECAE